MRKIWLLYQNMKLSQLIRESNLLSYLIDSELDNRVKKNLKFLLGVNKSTATQPILGETGIFPFFVHGFLSSLIF